jgi:hypothetical protein
VIDVACSKGAFHRGVCEDDLVKTAEKALAEYPPEVLDAVGEWLGALPREAYEEVIDGEDGAAHVVMASGPPFIDDVLNAVWEAV